MAFALAGVGMLLLLEPDLGAFMVIVAIAIGILFLGGINGKYFSSLLGVLVSTFLMLIWLSPWRRARLFAYLDPWNEDNAYGSAYQLSHSLIALGRGEWLGVGLGASVEKLHYLPEAHTDFLMAVVGEELGFAGVMLVISLFAIIVYRGFDIGRRPSPWNARSPAVAHGVAMWFGVQAFINMGVCLGLLPTKGLTLPLMSYGGSGVVMNLCALAMLIRVDVENRVMMRGDGYDERPDHPHHGRWHRRPHHARPAVADVLRQRGWRVLWLGNPDKMEGRLVPPRGIELVPLRFAGVRGKGAAALLNCRSCCCAPSPRPGDGCPPSSRTWCWAWAATWPFPAA